MLAEPLGTGAGSFKRVLGRWPDNLEILWSQPRMLGDSRHHPWPNFLIVMKGKHEIGGTGTTEGAV